MVHCVYVVSGDALKSVPIRIAFLLILILYIESWFFKRSYTMSGKETKMFLLRLLQENVLKRRIIDVDELKQRLASV